MRILVLAGSALGVLAGPAMAVDLEAPTSVFSWTRCYIGATVGGAAGKSNVSWAPNPAGFSKVGPIIAAATLATMSSSGFAGGGEGGCNYQVNNWFVLGLEGDIQYTGLSATDTGTNPRLKVGNSFTETFSSDWLSTVRSRAGIANGQWLFFATAGWAQANVSFSDFIFYPSSSTTNAASNSAMHEGWTAGTGAEWAFAPRWSVKAEYLYVGLGTTSFTSANSNPALFPRASIVHSHSLAENIGRFGVNRAF